MDRRYFLKIGSGSTALFIIPPGITKFYAQTQAGLDIQNGFSNPSSLSKPFTWWHWMNGNVTSDGITMDLEFMKEAGLGGFQIFQVGTGIPKGPVNFGSSEWLSLLQHAAKEAERLGLEYDMMNGGGWSSSGGPWITPELSMQQLTWTEAYLKGGKKISMTLPQPLTKLNYYRDAFVVAFPSPKGTGPAFNIDLVKRVTSDKGEVDKKIFSQGFWNSIEAQNNNDGISFLEIEFNEPFEASSVMLYGEHSPSSRRRFFGNHSSSIALESSVDGQTFSKVCDFPVINVRKESLDVPSTTNFSPVKARIFRFNFPDSARIYSLRLLPGACIEDWPTKANFTRRGTVTAGNMLYSSKEVLRGSIIPLKSVVDITKLMDNDGTLHWDAPEGDWTILRLGQTAVGVQNHPSPDGGGGLECDKYSKAAYDFHFNHFFGELLPFLESMGKNRMSGSVIDSYEVGMQTWTKLYPEEFKSRRGYDITGYLPALVGYVVGSTKDSDRFLWDIRRTDADLMDDNYYGRYVELCHQHQMKAYCEPYSGGPFDEFSAGSKMDVPMGEFWCGLGASNGVFYSIKLASSIAHIYGKKINAAESYTGVPSQTKWQMYPYAIKAEGDWMYTMGLNKYIFHVYAMQPNPTAKPGMTMGPWGWMHSRTNSWAGEEKDWLSYVHRAQYILQQGITVADLVYFIGEQVPTDTPVLPAQLSPRPPKGYDYDVTDGNGILTRMKVDKNQIVLPDGKRFNLLILPDSKVISLNVLEKLEELVKGGAWILGPRPDHQPGLSGGDEADAKLNQLAEKMWGDLDGVQKTNRSYGKGKIFWGEAIDNILAELHLTPDFEFSSSLGDAPINYIHLLIDDTDVYFIANRRRQPEDIVCTFRIKGKSPELWNPDNGSISTYPYYEVLENSTRLPLHLDPAGSVFVVFKSKSANAGIVSVEKNGKKIMSTLSFPKKSDNEYAQSANDFSVSVWVKPDVEINLEQGNEVKSASVISFVFCPPPGSTLYGNGHACCGLTAGRNGIVVYERTGEDLEPALVLAKHLSGWTHLCLVYKSGKPVLYVNGQLSAEGYPSKYIVHPGLSGVFKDDIDISYFHGDVGNLRLHDTVLSEFNVYDIYKKGIPSPLPPRSFESMENNTSESKRILFWENGNYDFQNQNGQTVNLQINEIPDPVLVEGGWQVSFPPGLGAPMSIHLDKLISLKDHINDGVKYFSGTASYQKSIQISSRILDANKKFYLDLGWVEVIAQVELNGKVAGTLWKPPFRLDISDLVHSGENELVINVTNQWVNRLIGDEHLPPENEYGNGGVGPGAEFGNMIKKLPAWYVEGKPKPPGGRITFTTWKHYDKDDPLLESGLLGPVYVRVAEQRSLPL